MEYEGLCQYRLFQHVINVYTCSLFTKVNRVRKRQKKHTTSRQATTNNNLFGGQFGGRFDWEVAPRMRFVVVPKFLLAGNASSNRATQSSGPPENIRSAVDVFSWLGSVDTSVAWDISERWSLWLGYRVVGVGNIAQADGQWPSTLPASAASLEGIGTGSESIIHGAFTGFESRY